MRLSAHVINAIIWAGTRIIIRDESIYINIEAKYRQFQCVYTLFMPLVACGFYILLNQILNNTVSVLFIYVSTIFQSSSG